MATTPIRTLLKRDESYAIHALINIFENPGTHAAEIAERLKVPPAFLAKVLRKLVKAGFIRSHMGRNGGVELLVDLGGLTMLHVIEAVSGPVVVDTCQTQLRCATQQRKGHCRLNLAWANTGVAVRAAFEQVMLSTLCDPPAAAPSASAPRPA